MYGARRVIGWLVGWLGQSSGDRVVLAWDGWLVGWLVGLLGWVGWFVGGLVGLLFG